MRDLLAGKYEGIPASLVLVISGRNELSKNLWGTYSAITCFLPLEPFPETVARDYLARKGITNEQVLEVILRLSGGLPLLLATLATEGINDPTKVTDPTSTAIERFLKWVDDPIKRDIALNAALPRYLNRDIFTQIVDHGNAEELFRWLKKNPFVQERGGLLIYHSVVRSQMLHFKQQESPQGWSKLHAKLTDFYENLRSELELNEKTGRRNPDWQKLTLEIVYHRLCSSPTKNTSFALNGFFGILEYPRVFARQWADAIYVVGSDTDNAPLKELGQLLIDALRNYDENHYESVSFVGVYCATCCHPK